MNVVVSLIFLFSLSGLTKCERARPSYLPPPPYPSSPKECPPREECKDIACALFVCPYGNDPLACTCCPTCLKGPGDSCGGPSDEEGRCTKDHICVDETLQEIRPSGYRTPVGKCRSRFCPDCALIDCLSEELLKCEKGTIRDPFCGCCSACKKGLNEECGGDVSSKGGCPREDALVCKDDQQMEIFQQELNTPVGTCQYGDGIPIPGGEEEECPNCAVVLCGIPKCDFGTETDPVCGCCPVCLKGPGDSCGGESNRNGSCAEGFECENFVCVQEGSGGSGGGSGGSGGSKTDVKPATLIGYASDIPPSEMYGAEANECPKCEEIACSNPKCDFGTEIDPVCGCCLVCKKGPGESCGGENNENGQCGDRLRCDNGKCVKIEPGCLDCRLVRVKCRSPESLGCPDDYEVSTCSCCPQCRTVKGYF